MPALLDNNLHNTRGEMQGTAHLMGCIGATSLAAARTAGLLDFGNFMGSEIIGEAKTTDKFRGVRGRVIKSGSTPGPITIGYKFKTQEVADKRKFQFALLGEVVGDLAQAAVAATAVDAIVFSVGVPSVPGRWYPILQGGARRVELSACAIAGKVEGTDFVVDYKLGQVRFITVQTANCVPTISCPAIDAASQFAMIGVTPGTRSIWTGYWSVYFFDQDANHNLILRHEYFLGDLKVTTFPKQEGENNAELEFEISINPGENSTAWHRP